MHDDGWPRHRRLVRAKSLVFGIRRRPKSRPYSSGQAYQTRVDLRLPVVQTTKFEFVINLSSAKVLSFPPGLLAIADEVIE